MNVYYLPARQAATPELPIIASRWSVLRARGYEAWARVRLTTIDVWSALRRGGQRPSLDDRIWFAEDLAAPRRRPLGPARIIDLEAARRRRAPAAVSARA